MNNDALELEMKRLDFLAGQARKIEHAIKESTAHFQGDLLGVLEAEQKLEEKRNKIHAEIRQAAGPLAAKLDDIKDEMSIAQAAIKRMLHDSPAEEAHYSKKLNVGRVQVSVSRVSVRRSYNPRLLADIPWLQNHEVDCEPVVDMVVKPHMISALLKMGDFSEDEMELIKDCEVLTKERTPSVRITLGETDE